MQIELDQQLIELDQQFIRFYATLSLQFRSLNLNSYLILFK